jgi:hypothetical protein
MRTCLPHCFARYDFHCLGVGTLTCIPTSRRGLLRQPVIFSPRSIRAAPPGATAAGCPVLTMRIKRHCGPMMRIGDCAALYSAPGLFIVAAQSRAWWPIEGSWGKRWGKGVIESVWAPSCATATVSGSPYAHRRFASCALRFLTCRSWRAGRQ